MSFYTAYNLDCKMLLLNPAFDRIPEYIDGWKCNGSQQMAKIQILLGKNDEDVDPKKTLQFLEDNKIQANIIELDVGHRIPFDIFTVEFEKFVEKYDLC